jgi:hypothetical protein
MKSGAYARLAQLNSPSNHGTTQIISEPLDFIAKLEAV